MAALGALALLAWTCRHALFGTPVADDFYFLERARLAGPIDLLDGGGFDYYWRPLARQLYYAAFGEAMLRTPWLLGALHGAALLALSGLLWRITRRFLAPLPALFCALLPLVAESSRLLLAWPTCAQPLLGAVGVAGAAEAILAGRTLRCALAFLAALLCYEQAAWAAPILLALGARAHDPGTRARRLGAILATLALWVAGLALARAHGVQWPAAGAAGAAVTPAAPVGPGAILAHVLAVLGNVDTLAGPSGSLLLIVQGFILLAAGVAWKLRAPVRAHGGTEPLPGIAIAACAAWGVVGLAPAALAPDLWAPRHALLPSLILGFAAIALCARGGRWFAPALVAARALALLAAPIASATDLETVQGDSRTSFVELVRLQRILASTQRCFATFQGETHAGAAYWVLPTRAAVGFAAHRAARVWAADSSFGWGWMERPARSERQRSYAVLTFDTGDPDPARRVHPEVVDAYFAAVALSDRQDLAGADSSLAEAVRLNGSRPVSVRDELERLRAGLAAMRGELALAESLNLVSQARSGTKPDHMAIDGWIAMQHGDEARARELAELCLRYEPDHPTGRALLLALEQRAARRVPGSGQGDRPVTGTGR